MQINVPDDLGEKVVAALPIMYMACIYGMFYITQT